MLKFKLLEYPSTVHNLADEPLAALSPSPARRLPHYGRQHASAAISIRLQFEADGEPYVCYESLITSDLEDSPSSSSLFQILDQG